MAATRMAELPEAHKQELLCSYATLILHDDNLAVTEDNILKLISAAGCKVEPYVPMLFARALQGKDVGTFLTCGGGPAAGPAVVEAPVAAKETKKEAKKEEKKEEEEEDDNLGFSLFD